MTDQTRTKMDDSPAAGVNRLPCKHTSGPWSYSLLKLSATVVSGFTIKTPDPEKWHGIAGCGVYEPNNNACFTSEELAANARLIAAAPELLDALKAVISELPIQRDWLDPDIEALARQIIRKAQSGVEEGRGSR